MEALTRDAIVRDFCRKKGLGHHAAQCGRWRGRPVSSCSAPSSHATVGSFHIRPQIERVTRVKDKKEKTRAQLAAACSVVSRVSNCQIGQRNRQPLCHPLLPRLQTSRCRHAADRTVRVGAARRGGDLWSFFHEPTFAPLRHQKGLSVRAGSQRAKESPLLCPPQGRETRRWCRVSLLFLLYSLLLPVEAQ